MKWTNYYKEIPKEEKYYLTASWDKRNKIYRVTENKWLTQFGWAEYRMGNEEVTHWMELPEPPMRVE